MTVRKTSTSRTPIKTAWPTSPRAVPEDLSKPLPATPKKEVDRAHDDATERSVADPVRVVEESNDAGAETDVLQSERSIPRSKHPESETRQDDLEGQNARASPTTPSSSRETGKVREGVPDVAVRTQGTVIPSEDAYSPVTSNPFRRPREQKPPVLDMPDLGGENSAEIWELDWRQMDTIAGQEGPLSELPVISADTSAKHLSGSTEIWADEKLISATANAPVVNEPAGGQEKGLDSSSSKENEALRRSYDTGTNIAAASATVENSSPQFPPAHARFVPLSPSGAAEPSNSQHISSTLEDAYNSDPYLAFDPMDSQLEETYDIRHVLWDHGSIMSKPKHVPVMVQNKNGPCPLLALVNAMVLSLSSSRSSIFVEKLSGHEQISLGLLIEYISGHLLSTPSLAFIQGTPNFLYNFLFRLHRGMDVNPKFVQDDAPVNLMDTPTVDMSPDHSLHRLFGSFETTRNMRTYSVFGIPLVHGWFIAPQHPAFTTFEQVAQDYESAQMMLVQEEDLELKLSTTGLNPEEQKLLEDIGNIKSFLSTTATELTEHGLSTIAQSLAPGAIIIFFRNDHFSTLYKHPLSGKLFTLVTDMGYAHREEVVWQSLVDVNGEGSEFFSGDFKPVGNIGDVQETVTVDEEGWEQVTRNRREQTSASQDRHQRHSQAATAAAMQNLEPGENQPGLTDREREDHDFALALQMQEEEEDRHRQEQAARRREDELSERYVTNTDASGRRTFPGLGRGARGGAPQVPPRGNSVAAQGRGSARQAPPVARPRDSTDEPPPPSYEQAASRPAYHPPEYHPAHPNASPSPTTPSRPQGMRHRQTSSAYSEHAAAYAGSPSTHGPPLPRRPTRERGPLGEEETPRMGRRSRSGDVDVVGRDGKKDRNCTMM